MEISVECLDRARVASREFYAFFCSYYQVCTKAVTEGSERIIESSAKKITIDRSRYVLS